MRITKVEFLEAQKVLSLFINEDKNFATIEQCSNAIAKAFTNGNKLIVCGNGGSMTDAMHFAEEFSGRYKNNRHPLPAIAISDPAYITCTANDYGFDHVFSRFVDGFGKNGDVLFAISTSGNSVNVVKAAETAKAKGMFVIGLTGNSGGKLASFCDVEIRVLHQGFSDRIQELHILIIHSIVNCVEKMLNVEC